MSTITGAEAAGGLGPFGYTSGTRTQEEQGRETETKEPLTLNNDGAILLLTRGAAALEIQRTAELDQKRAAKQEQDNNAERQAALDEARKQSLKSQGLLDDPVEPDDDPSLINASSKNSKVDDAQSSEALGVASPIPQGAAAEPPADDGQELIPSNERYLDVLA